MEGSGEHLEFRARPTAALEHAPEHEATGTGGSSSCLLHRGMKAGLGLTRQPPLGNWRDRLRGDDGRLGFRPPLGAGREGGGGGAVGLTGAGLELGCG